MIINFYLDLKKKSTCTIYIFTQSSFLKEIIIVLKNGHGHQAFLNQILFIFPIRCVHYDPVSHQPEEGHLPPGL